MGTQKNNDDEVNQQQADEQHRQNQIRKGTKDVNNIIDSQFTPDFFTKRQNDYSAYATPQLQDQFGDAQKQLTYALDRGGNLDSSARASQTSDLQKQFNTQQAQIADQALSYGTQARNAVESARSGLITDLNASGDATGASNAALSQASALAAPVAFSPLTGLFSNFTSALGTQAALEKASALSGGAISPTYNTGLFAPKGAVKVTT